MGDMIDSANGILSSAQTKAAEIFEGCGDFKEAVGEDYMLNRIRDEKTLKKLMKMKVARGLALDDQ
jgi:hypothetical protein